MSENRYQDMGESDILYQRGELLKRAENSSDTEVHALRKKLQDDLAYSERVYGRDMIKDFPGAMQVTMTKLRNKLDQK